MVEVRGISVFPLCPAWDHFGPQFSIRGFPSCIHILQLIKLQECHSCKGSTSSCLSRGPEEDDEVVGLGFPQAPGAGSPLSSVPTPQLCPAAALGRRCPFTEVAKIGEIPACSHSVMGPIRLQWKTMTC